MTRSLRTAGGPGRSPAVAERRFSGAVPVEVVADGGVAAAIAERLDFPEQVGGVAAALACTLVQAGFEALSWRP